MGRIRAVWLLLALPGAAIPLLFLSQWFQTNPISLEALLLAWTADAATLALFWDLGLSAVTLSLAVLAHALSHRSWLPLVCLPATWLVGVSFGLPLFLFFLTRAPRRGLKARDET